MMTYPLENLLRLQEYAYFSLKITVFEDSRYEDWCHFTEYIFSSN